MCETVMGYATLSDCPSEEAVEAGVCFWSGAASSEDGGAENQYGQKNGDKFSHGGRLL